MIRRKKRYSIPPKDRSAQTPRMHDCRYYDLCLQSAANSNREIDGCNDKCSRFERTQIRPTMQTCERDNRNKFERWG